MKERSATDKTVKEPAREVRVCAEADVVVVGGGPAGIGAAVAAARNGASTVLVERYGHLGGMATGGLVLVVPQVFAGTDEWRMAGVCQEIIDRADALGGCMHPNKAEVGSTDPAVVASWAHRTFGGMRGRVGLSAYFDPEILKCVLNNMVEEVGIKLFLHSWGTQAVVDNNKVRGIIFESKSGRQAILGKIVVDTTGDGDMFASAGAGFDIAKGGDYRSSQLALVYRVGNVDVKKYWEFRLAEPKKLEDLVHKMENMWSEESRARLTPSMMTKYRMLPQATARGDVIWVNNWIGGLSSIDIADLTWVELNVRKIMLLWHDYARKNFPGFEKSFILDTAPQLGTRGSRRLIGEYVVTMQDMRSGTVHKDTIAVFRRMGPPGEQAYAYLPYRALVPSQTDGLLAAGRCFSSDAMANNMANLIPHCIASGQAAGTAAALAVKQGVNPRQLDYKVLQERLISQGVPLPGVM